MFESFNFKYISLTLLRANLTSIEYSRLKLYLWFQYRYREKELCVYMRRFVCDYFIVYRKKPISSELCTKINNNEFVSFYYKYRLLESLVNILLKYSD